MCGSTPTTAPEGGERGAPPAAVSLRRLWLELLPKVLLSRLTGVVAGLPLPRALRPPLYRAFARRYGADLSELDRPLEDFRCFGDFFARPLRAGARPPDPDPRALLSPVDGRLASCGPIRDGRLTQVKGRDYALADFARGLPDLERFAGGFQLTLYLAPGDYHRIHSPCAGRLTAFSRVPGTCFPVNPKAARAVPRLYARNERVLVLFEDTPFGALALGAVAAFNVADLDFPALPPRRGRRPEAARLEPPLAVAAGAELARFRLGSTVVLLLEPGRLEPTALEAGTRLRAGRALGRARPP